MPALAAWHPDAPAIGIRDPSAGEAFGVVGVVAIVFFQGGNDCSLKGVIRGSATGPNWTAMNGFLGFAETDAGDLSQGANTFDLGCATLAEVAQKAVTVCGKRPELGYGFVRNDLRGTGQSISSNAPPEFTTSLNYRM